MAKDNTFKAQDAAGWLLLIGGGLLLHKFFGGPGVPDPGDMPGADGQQGWPAEQKRRTLSDAQLEVACQMFYAGFWWGEFSEDEAAMTSAVLQCNTNADLVAFIQRYGARRGPYISNIGDAPGVVECIQRGLDAEEIADLNSALHEKGITLSF